MHAIINPSARVVAGPPLYSRRSKHCAVDRRDPDHSHRAILFARGARGFTLLELIIAVAVLGILSTLAAPAFNDLILASRARSAASDVYTSLIFARSEALKRNANVAIVPNGTWTNGWQVLAGATLLRDQQTVASLSIECPGGTNCNATITYRRDGRLNNATPQMVIYVSGNNRVQARCISVDPSGRPNIRVDTNNNAADGCQ